MRLHECRAPSSPLRGATLRTAKTARTCRELSLDGAFWRVVGLYLAEGAIATAVAPAALVVPSRPASSISWTRSRRLAATGRQRPTCSRSPRRTRSRAVAAGVAWWTKVLGPRPQRSYEQRLPDLIWDRPAADKRACCPVCSKATGRGRSSTGGPSVHRRDRHGQRRARRRRPAAARGSRHRRLPTDRSRGEVDEGHALDAHQRRRAGRARNRARARARPARRPRVRRAAGQADRADRLRAVRRRRGVGARHDDRAAAVRGHVYSIEVPGPHTRSSPPAGSSHNCFPKDVTALKQLAGNSGYHFQLLNAVIEVNELQKRRVIDKLQKHLGSLVGKRSRCSAWPSSPTPTTCARRRSLVLSARLQADGAKVVAPTTRSPRTRRGELMPGRRVRRHGAGARSRGADAAVLVTEWDEFKELDLAEVARPWRQPSSSTAATRWTRGGSRRRARLRGHRAIVRRRTCRR